MRRFLLIFACAFSFCVHAETNTVVQVDPVQWYSVSQLSQLFRYLNFLYLSIENNSDGSISSEEDMTVYPDFLYVNQYNQLELAKIIHQFFTGNELGSYDTSSNNVLAYASSLREHNADVRELLAGIEESTHGTWNTAVGLVPYFGGIWNTTKLFHSDYTNNFNRFYGNFNDNLDRLYDALTNINFNVSISNQIDLLQVMNGGISNNFESISNILDSIYRFMQDWHGNQMAAFDSVKNHMHRDHDELMDFLHSLSNSTLFASNLCCCVSNDSIVAMLEWMTNHWWSSTGSDDEIHGGDSSNSVWWAWRPDDEAWPNLLIPALEWRQDSETLGWLPSYKPKDDQYDRYFLGIAQQYNDLLEGFETGDIKGQEFLTGLVDLQLHIMANMSTQLYMIDSKMPSKTNLWDWIEEYKSKVSEEVTKAEQENSEIVSSVSSLLDYTPFSIVGGHFPKVSTALNSLKVEEGASPVVRIPIPRALRVSDSDELVVDVRESQWYGNGRNWCRWIFTFIWGWLFIRLGLVPIFYVFFFTVRVAEISAHLVFMGSIRGSSGIVSSFGAAAVDMVLSLIGIDTDFKKFVWGIMRN